MYKNGSQHETWYQLVESPASADFGDSETHYRKFPLRMCPGRVTDMCTAFLEHQTRYRKSVWNCRRKLSRGWIISFSERSVLIWAQKSKKLQLAFRILSNDSRLPLSHLSRYCYWFQVNTKTRKTVPNALVQNCKLRCDSTRLRSWEAVIVINRRDTLNSFWAQKCV